MEAVRVLSLCALLCAAAGARAEDCVLVGEFPGPSGLSRQTRTMSGSEECEREKARAEAALAALGGGGAYSCDCPRSAGTAPSAGKAAPRSRLAEPAPAAERAGREEFIRRRDAANRTLKGVKRESGPVPDHRLKDGGLKGADTAAWQQRQCADEIKGRLRDAVRGGKPPFDVVKLSEMRDYTLKVLRGGELNPDCRAKKILDLRPHQPDNAGWVERYRAELDGYIKEAERLNAGGRR